MKLLTLARDLTRRRSRERHGLFVAEGVRTVEELLLSPLRIKGALATARLVETPRGAALRELLASRHVPVTEVTEPELASAADTETPQGIVAIAEVPQRSLGDLPADGTVRLVVLDALQDPGNVGTIVRTAAALGATATLAMPGTVDLWNAKVVRGGMGASFVHPALSCTWEQLSSFRQERHIETWVTAMEGDPLTAELARAAPDRLALVVGNEGSGISDEARSIADRSVSLPVSSAVESLNVAVATGIFLYALRR